MQSSSDRASFPATAFQFGRALLSCLSWRSLARSAEDHARGVTDPIGEREREMLRAFAVFSRWLPVEWRRRSGAGLGAARSGDFDSVDFGIGTSSAAGAVRWAMDFARGYVLSHRFFVIVCNKGGRGRYHVACIW